MHYLNSAIIRYFFIILLHKRGVIYMLSSKKEEVVKDEDKENTGLFNLLPREIKLHLFSFFTYPKFNLSSLRSTCQGFRNLLSFEEQLKLSKQMSLKRALSFLESTYQHVTETEKKELVKKYALDRIQKEISQLNDSETLKFLTTEDCRWKNGLEENYYSRPVYD